MSTFFSELQQVIFDAFKLLYTNESVNQIGFSLPRTKYIFTKCLKAILVFKNVSLLRIFSLRSVSGMNVKFFRKNIGKEIKRTEQDVQDD